MVAGCSDTCTSSLDSPPAGAIVQPRSKLHPLVAPDRGLDTYGPIVSDRDGTGKGDPIFGALAAGSPVGGPCDLLTGGRAICAGRSTLTSSERSTTTS